VVVLIFFLISIFHRVGLGVLSSVGRYGKWCSLFSSFLVSSFLASLYLFTLLLSEERTIRGVGAALASSYPLSCYEPVLSLFRDHMLSGRVGATSNIELVLSSMSITVMTSSIW
jgi:hypothetical protein